MVVDQVLVPSRETGVARAEYSSGTNGTDGRDGHRARDESRFKGGTISVDGCRNAVPPAKPRPAGQNPKAEAAESDLALVPAAAASDNRSETEEV